MKFRTSASLIALGLLSIGGANAQSSSSVLSSPFGQTVKSAVNAAGITKQQARNALSAAALAKADARHLDRLLENETNEFIVLFADEAPARAAVAASQREALELKKSAYAATRKRVRAQFDASELEFVREFSYTPDALVRVNSRAALVKLLNRSDVKLIVENVKAVRSMAESLPLIHQPDAVTAGRNGAGTTVAVLDGGTDYRRTAFGSCTSPGVPATCRVVAAVATGSEPYSLNDDHGTNVAGIVAGVAGGARIAAIDVFDSTGGTLAMVKAGVDWAIGNQSTYNIVAMNLSLNFLNLGKYTSACSSDPVGAYVTQMFASARAVNIVPIVSAGNMGYLDGVNSPACAANAVSVGAFYDANIGGVSYSSPFACTDASTAVNKVSCFSNGGDLVTMFAPGAAITAANVTEYGTSQAAPHVAGAVAVLRGANAAPSDSIDQTIARLKNTGLTITDQRNGKVKPRLDLAASLIGLIPDPAYRTVSQQVYLAYFGRPADPGGLYWFANTLKNAGAPSDVVALEQAYNSNATVKALIDSFGTSAESNALYGGDNTAYVTAVYQNLFNRNPDSGGLQFWVNALNSGGLTRGKAALSIMAAGMPNADGVTITKKSSVAVNFTKSLDLAPEISAYNGATAAAKARTMLKQVGSGTDVNAFQPTVDATIAQIVSGQ